MRYIIPCLIMLFAVACGESDSDSESNGTPNDNADASMGDAEAPAGEMITVTYIARNAQTGEVIAGADVCIDGRDCIQTDADVFSCSIKKICRTVATCMRDQHAIPCLKRECRRLSETFV